jgi:phosphoribosylanthranilate isomerase
MEQYLDVCDYFLFDTKSESHGGSGQTFDWDILKQYPYTKPFFLSGGLSLDNIAEVSSLKSLPLYGIDVNSRFEISPGLKDVAKLQELRWRL